MEALELAISTIEATGIYRADILRSPGGGTASGPVAIDVGEILARRGELEKAVLLGRLAPGLADPSERRMRATGRTLFTALFGGGQVGAMYRASVALANAAREELSVVLRTTDPALAALPWEIMYDDVAGEYLSQRRQLVRHVDAPAGPPLPLTLPLRVLGVVSSPTDRPRLDIAKEQAQLTSALARAAGGLAQLTWAKSASWAELQDLLLAGQWHVVHFIGHGEFSARLGQGVLALTGEQGQAHLVTADEFATLLHRAAPVPRLVVLNSCSGAAASTRDLFSGTATALVRDGVRAVAAMQYAVSDRAAIAFSRGFYGAIIAGHGIDEAVSSGRVAILGLPGHSLEWVTPVLHRSGADRPWFPVPGSGGVASIAPRATVKIPSRLTRSVDAHDGGVFSVAFGAAGPLLASAGGDQAVRLWNPGIWTEAGAFASPAASVQAAVFSRDGRELATGWSDGRVRLFSPAGRLADGSARTTGGHSGQVLDIAFSPDGTQVASAGEDGRVIIHPVTGQRAAVSLPRPQGAVHAVAFNPDGTLLATAGEDQVVRLWSVAGLSERRALTGHTAHVTGLAFSPDGRLLASAGHDGSVRLWDVAAGKPGRILADGFNRAWSVAFCLDGLLAAGTDDHVTFWDSTTGELLGTAGGDAGNPGPGPGDVLSVAFSPDGTLLTAASAAGQLLIWR